MNLGLDRAADGLLAVDTEGAVIAANPAAARLPNAGDVSGLVGRKMFESPPPAVATSSTEGTETRVDVEMLCKCGKRVPVTITVTGEPETRVATIHDRTEDIEHSERMAVLEKTRVIGQMTGGVAHDFNNILAAISLNPEVVEEMIGESPIWENHLSPALRAAGRGARLTGHLLAFARRRPLAPEAINLQAEFDDFKTMIQRSPGERWTIDPAPGSRIILDEDGLPSVRAPVVEDDAEEALVMVDEGSEFDPPFTDVVLPGATGRQLADRSRKLRPAPRVLHTSGRTENAVIRRGRLDPDVTPLSKPYTRDALRAALRNARSGES